MDAVFIEDHTYSQKADWRLHFGETRQRGTKGGKQMDIGLKNDKIVYLYNLLDIAVPSLFVPGERGQRSCIHII